MYPKSSLDNEGPLPDRGSQSLADGDASRKRKKRRHDHLGDVGFGSFTAYFFCMLASVSIRASGFNAGSSDESVILSFLLFVGASSFALLFLALAEQYLIRHDNQEQFSIAAGLLLTVGPIVSMAEGVLGSSSVFILFVAFSLSGCGWAMCLLVWGRVLSSKEDRDSSLQVLADVCAAVVVMVAVSATPPLVGSIALLCLGTAAGFVGSRRAVPIAAGCEREGQIVVSDTRNVIPRTSYFVGGTLWMVFGILLTLLRESPVFDGHMSVAVVLLLLVAAMAGIVIVRLHWNWDAGLAKLSWAPVPLLVTGLAFFIVGDQQMLRLALVFIVLSMIISYLYFMVHFAMLAH